MRSRCLLKPFIVIHAPAHPTAEIRPLDIEEACVDKPFWPIVEVYLLIAAIRACTISSVVVVPVLDDVADEELVAVDESELDSLPEPSRGSKPPGGGPWGGFRLSMADKNWLSVKLLVFSVSSELHISSACSSLTSSGRLETNDAVTILVEALDEHVWSMPEGGFFRKDLGAE